MKNVILSLFFAAVLLTSGGLVLAQDTRLPGTGAEDERVPGFGGENTRGGSISLQNPIQANNITELFESIIDILLVFAVPLIVVFIIYAGFLYVTARGNESTIQKAHMALAFALLGGVIILGAKVLITVIGGTVDSFYN